MDEFIRSHEVAIRLAFFLGAFGAMALWETLAPRRDLTVRRSLRWANNLGLVILNSVVLRVLFPAAAVGVAAVAEARGWGVFNNLSAPGWFAVLGSAVALDFIIYLQHVMVHAVPALWRLHRVHHADLDFDVTTGARFHPIEIILSMLIKFAAIVLIGAPVLAVVIFEVLLNATAMFNHGNVRIARALDRALRWIVVTPDMHRVHHSVDADETNSNFGFNLPWWDRLFGTYRHEPRAGHAAMTVGIAEYRDPRHCVWLPGLLALPFTGSGSGSGYAINRREWPHADAH